MGGSDPQSTRSGRRQRGDLRQTLLVFVNGTTTEHPLPQSGTILIGRGRTADLVIDHPSLSRAHARLTVGAHLTIEDCGSRNGTFLAGRALAPNTSALVAAGSAIELGDVVLVIRATETGPDLLASSAPGGSLDRVVAQVAASTLPVFILGEIGAGKSHLAQRIHERSGPPGRPFVVLRAANVGGASEIAGAVASARGGTLLVHEPSALDRAGQTTLLRCLGAPSDGGPIRIVTATSRDLAQLAERGAFSVDLLTRLSGVTIVVPPLRARLAELPALVDAILVALAAQQQRPPLLLSADALAALGRHTWPGNVRELDAVLARAAVLTKSRVLTAAHFDLEAGHEQDEAAGTLSSAVSEVERRRILDALRECNGNQTRAAKLLGISRGTLISRLNRYAVPRPRK